MTEKYKVELPTGLAVSVEDPKLLHRIADTILVPVEALADFTASAIGVLQIPLRLAQAKGERLIATVRAASDQVPPERQIEAPTSVAGPILESVRYLEPGSPLLTMYENLLARAMDRERVSEAHPAFPKVIEQLSPDEARLLYVIRNNPIKRTRQTVTYGARGDFNRRKAGIVTPETRTDTTPRSALLFPGNSDMYLDHLESLNLIFAIDHKPTVLEVPKDETKGTKRHTVITHTTTIQLTEFGALFAKACVPDTWNWPSA
jgi:hypothetical protein